jgi:polysaccharide biosynthesis transport protein
VGVALGIVFAGGSEFMDDRIHGEKGFTNLVPVPVISEIPEVPTADELSRRRTSDRLAWVAASVVVASILAGSALSYFRG